MAQPSTIDLPLTQQQWHLAAASLLDAYTDFILSRQALRCSSATLLFYKYTAGAFLTWIESQGITDPTEVTGRLVRQYLARLVGLGKSENTIYAHARAIRTLLLFWHREGRLPEKIVVEAREPVKKRQPSLSADQVDQVIAACASSRDKAIVMLLADSGLRRKELAGLDCGDVDLATGLIRVRHGKGGKERSAVVGATARRRLLAYGRDTGRDLRSPIYAEEPLFLSRNGSRLTGAALLLLFRRLSTRVGIHVTAHSLRRTFAILSLRAGMDSLHLQALGGWEDFTMVRRYAQLVDDDLLEAHRLHSPIDSLAKLRQPSAAAKAFPAGPPEQKTAPGSGPGTAGDELETRLR